MRSKSALRPVHSSWTWRNWPERVGSVTHRVHWSRAPVSRLHLVLVGCSETRPVGAWSFFNAMSFLHNEPCKMDFSSCAVITDKVTVIRVSWCLKFTVWLELDQGSDVRETSFQGDGGVRWGEVQMSYILDTIYIRTRPFDRLLSYIYSPLRRTRSCISGRRTLITHTRDPTQLDDSHDHKQPLFCRPAAFGAAFAD